MSRKVDWKKRCAIIEERRKTEVSIVAQLLFDNRMDRARADFAETQLQQPCPFCGKKRGVEFKKEAK